MSSFLGKLVVFGAIWLSTSSALLSSKFSGSHLNSIILGTYEGFIDPEMVDHISSQYDMRVDYFDHDQVVKNKFKKGAYSLATVSTSILEELIDNNLLDTIDWSKLDLTFSAQDSSVKTKDSSKGSSDSSIFSDIVNEIVKSNQNLLKYGIPYFMNKLSFCYVGDEISELKSTSSELTWSTLISQISQNERFKPKKGKPSLGLIDDPRSILSLARFAKGSNDVNVSSAQSYDQIYSDYAQLINKGFNKSTMGSNFLLLDSNSVNLVDALVAGDIQGAIMYNADCLYASYGGSSGKAPAKLNAAKLSNNEDIYFLDFLVLSKNLSESQKTSVYTFLKDVLLHDHTQESSQILNKSSDKYQYWLARNFDYVKYTPVIKNLETGVNANYFSGSGNTTLEGTKKDIFEIKWSAQSNSGKSITKHYEKKLSSKEKSDMLVAFERFKDEL